MPSIKLTYFDFPGRAEPIRLFLKLSGIEFEDNRISRESWPELKPSVTPYHQVPFLEFDGKRIAQSNNILLFLADYFSKDNALVPADLVERYQCFQHIHGVEEIFATLGHTWHIQDVEARTETRTKLVSPGGATYAILTKFNDILKTQNYLHGDHLTVSDLTLYTVASFLTSGTLDGITREYITTTFPELAAFGARVAKDEKIQALYKDVEAPWVAMLKNW